jgi:F0F1-type ATP synthase membrane subunit a
MAAGPTNPTEYIQGTDPPGKPIGDGGAFWTLHVDSVVMAILIGVLTFGFLWWVTRRVTTGVPSKVQAFVELALISSTARPGGYTTATPSSSDRSRSPCSCSC